MRDEIGYARQLSKIYKEHSEEVMVCLKFSFVTKKLHKAYELLIGSKIKPIEQIEMNDKTALWETAKMFAADKQTRIVFCKCLYLLQQLAK